MKSNVNLNASFTRPEDTNAYQSGDIVGNSTTAADLVPMPFALGTSGGVMLRRARLTKNDTDVTNATFRLHLWSSKPTQANGDNGAMELRNLGSYLGYYEFVMLAGTNGAYAFALPAVGQEIITCEQNNKTIYGILEARGAYTPASAEVFTVMIENLQE
jgi:hypothetical protein